MTRTAAGVTLHLGSFPYTPPVAEIYALHACLEQYLAEGADAVLSGGRATISFTRRLNPKLSPRQSIPERNRGAVARGHHEDYQSEAV